MSVVMSAQAAVAAARAALLSEPRSDPSTTSASDDAAKARARCVLYTGPHTAALA